MVLPAWPRRFSEIEFRRFVEKTIRLETPAHIMPRICWVDQKQMQNFEKIYQRWLKVHFGQAKGSKTDTLDELIDALSNRRSYTIRLVDNERAEEVVISPVRALLSSDHRAVACALAGAGIAATAVGVRALPYIAPLVAEAISLRAGGFDVVDVAAGAEALNVLKQPEPTDALIVDVDLSNGAGRAVFDGLRTVDERDLPDCVVISALDREEVIRRYGDVSGHFLAKPFDPWNLVHVVEKLLSERNGGRGRPTSKRKGKPETTSVTS